MEFWVFYNSALIRLQMENTTACPSIIYCPLLAFKSHHRRYNYSHIICATGKKQFLHTCYSIKCLQMLRLLLLLSGKVIYFNTKGWCSAHIVSHWEPHIGHSQSHLHRLHEASWRLVFPPHYGINLRHAQRISTWCRDIKIYYTTSLLLLWVCFWPTPWSLYLVFFLLVLQPSISASNLFHCKLSFKCIC